MGEIIKKLKGMTLITTDDFPTTPEQIRHHSYADGYNQAIEDVIKIFKNTNETT